MARNKADELVGPFYRAEELANWLGLTCQQLDLQTEQRQLLRMISASGSKIFPVWQFDPKGKPLPGLAEVLALIDEDGTSPLGSALWLNRPATRFEGVTPAEMLRAGRKADVLVAARQIAAAQVRS